MSQTNPLPTPGVYHDQLGRTMIRERATDGAWELAQPKTQTGKFAKAIVAHRFAGKIGRIEAHWDGALDEKAMRELIRLGKAEGLIQTSECGRIEEVSAFLKELRPFQLDVVFEGARAIRKLADQAGDDRDFFEIASDWSGTWSDARANQLLRERLLGEVDIQGARSLPAVGRGTRKKSIAQVIRENATRLLALPGVEGIGHGRERGQDVIVVHTSVPVDQIRLPKTLGGYPVLKEFSGPFVPEANG